MGESAPAATASQVAPSLAVDGPAATAPGAPPAARVQRVRSLQLLHAPATQPERIAARPKGCSKCRNLKPGCFKSCWVQSGYAACIVDKIH